MLTVFLFPSRNSSGPTANDEGQAHADNTRATDEATLIEERRKRREAIKAKYRGQAALLHLEAIALDNASTPATPGQIIPEDQSQAPGEF